MTTTLLDIVNQEIDNTKVIKDLVYAQNAEGTYILRRLGFDIATDGAGNIALARGSDFLTLTEVREAIRLLAEQLGGACIWLDKIKAAEIEDMWELIGTDKMAREIMAEDIFANPSHEEFDSAKELAQNTDTSLRSRELTGGVYL